MRGNHDTSVRLDNRVLTDIGFSSIADVVYRYRPANGNLSGACPASRNGSDLCGLSGAYQDIAP